MICKIWKLSGKCDNFDCTYKHPEVCKEYNNNGICLNRYNCTFFHPVACRKMICFGQDCEFFHPINPTKRNVCKNWKLDGTCKYKNKCKFFHPIICEISSCLNQDCNLFHVGGYNIVPMRTKIMSFAQNGNSNIEEYKMELQNHMKYPDYYEMMLTQIVKYHRLEILVALFECDSNYIRLNRNLNYNVFTSLVWPKVSNENINLYNIKSIFQFLIEKKFKIFNENSKFENETFLDSLLHKDNPFYSDTKMELYNYFTSEWNNTTYCHDLLNSFLNILNESNVNKYCYIIIFLSVKNIDIFLKILYNKITYKFTDEIEVIINCLMKESDPKCMEHYYKINNVCNIELFFVNNITSNIDIFLKNYFESDKFKNMLQLDSVDIENEKNVIEGYFFELLGYIYKVNVNSNCRELILDYIYLKFTNNQWHKKCIFLFGKFLNRSEIIVNQNTYDLFKKILENIIKLRNNSNSNRLKLDNIISKHLNPKKKIMSEEDYEYLKCFIAL